MKTTKFQLFALLACIFLFTLPIISQETETEELQGEVYICVDPENAGNEAYLISLRETNLIGIIIPENADVTIYSEQPLDASLFTINTDALTGGYTAFAPIAIAVTGSNLIGDSACSGDLATLFPEATPPSTITLPVSQDRILTIRVNGDNSFVVPNIQGVYSFHFERSTARFQIAQLNSRNIQISFPSLGDTDKYIIIANKSVDVAASFGLIYEDARPSNARDIFIQQLIADGLDLFEIMQSDNVRIYPDHGYISDYRVGSFIQLEVTSSASVRDIGIDDVMSAIPGSMPGYVTENGQANTLNPTDQVTVEEITPEGQLLARNGRIGSGATVEAWLLEVIEDASATE